MAAPTLKPAAAAQALLRDFEERYDAAAAPPVPVERVAGSLLGLFIDEADDIRALPGAPTDQGRLSGMLDAEEMILWVDRGEARRSPGRRRFTIAHEIGHLLLHVPVFHRRSSTTGPPTSRRSKTTSPAGASRAAPARAGGQRLRP